VDLLFANSPEIRNHLKVRLLAGSQDTRLTAAIGQLETELAALNVRYESRTAEGADHDYPEIIDSTGDDYFAFWRD